ncbi:hypothetical protein ACKAMS_24845 [Rhodococcus sp. 5A-K4]|uniref:hypothetical protein n=1 Tax=Rhodococcus sp. 5A-K4 TaxID=3384442 RepID=UPI0038D497F5
MTGFATPAELDEFTSGSPDAAIAWATGFIRDYTHQTLTLVEDDVEICTARPDNTIQLREMPVGNISLVEAWTVDGYMPVTGYRWNPHGMLDCLGWHVHGNQFRVTYTHGYADLPDGLKQVALELAAIEQSNPTGLASRRVGEKQQTYVTRGAGIGLTEFQKAVLDRYAIEEVS